jgi:hypothetical protein
VVPTTSTSMSGAAISTTFPREGCGADRYLQLLRSEKFC